MGKPFEQTGGGGGATGHVEPPSLLSSFAGIIETGMLNVFQSVADKGDDSVSRVNSLRRAPGDNIVRGGGGERGSAATEGNDAISKRLSGRLSRLASESESDMPGLERLERSTCPASSEDEVEDFLDKRHGLKHDDGVDPSSMVIVGESGVTSCGTAFATKNTARGQNKSSASSLRSSASRDTRTSNVSGDPGGHTALWARRGTCTSSASTFVPGMSPARTPASGTESFSGGGGGGENTSRGGIGQHPSREGQGSGSLWSAEDKGDRLGLGRPVGTDLNPGSTACSTSAVGGKTSNRPIPAPLDISVLPDPAPPSRLKHTSSSSSSVPTSNPVVLQGAALENLKKLGQAGSGVGTGSGSKGGGISAVVAYASRRSSSGGGEALSLSRSGDPPGGVRKSKHASNGGLPKILEPEPPRKQTGTGFRTTGGVRVAGGLQEELAVQRPKSGSSWTRSESTYAREACKSPPTFGRSIEGEGDSDDAPPPPSPMLTAHLRSDKAQQQQQGRGRGAFKGRGLRPATWTQDDGGQPLPPPPAAQQGAAAVGQAHLRLVLQQKGAEGDGNSDDVSPMGTPLSMISVSTNGRGGSDLREKPPLAVTSKERMPTPKDLARVAADIARRGASANAELVPGLGRRAFEHISFSPTIPLRAISSNDNHNIPAAGGAGGGVSLDKKLPVDAKKWATTGDNSGAVKPHVFGANKSRSSGGFDDSMSVSSGGRSGVYLDAPSLTVAHAPGRIHRSQQHQGGHTASLAKGTPATNSHGHGGARNDRTPPLRLSSSNRLTSFDSRRSSVSPEGWDGRDVGHNPVIARRGSSGADRPKRPTTIDMLSTFGSHHSLPREEDFSRKTDPALKSLQSHPEEDPSEGGAGSQGKHFGRHSSSGTRRSSGREDRISQRRSRSSGSSVGGARRFNSTGSALMGVGSDDTRSSSSRGRMRSGSRSRSGGEVPNEERKNSRRAKHRRDCSFENASKSSGRGDSLDEFEPRRHPQGRGRSAEVSQSRRHSHRPSSGDGGRGVARAGSDEHVSSRGRSNAHGKSDRHVERRRHSGHHRRRPSGVHGPMASEASSNRDGRRGHRRPGSAPSLESIEFASSGGHRRRASGRREGTGSSDCHKSSSGAQRYGREGISGRRQSGRSSRRDSAKNRKTRADAQARDEEEEEEEKNGDEVEAGRLGVVAVNGVLPVDVDREVAPVSGASDRKQRTSKTSKKNPSSPGSPRNGGRARRTPMVQKKGRTRRTLLGVSAFWRGGRSDRHHDAAVATGTVSEGGSGHGISRTDSGDLAATECSDGCSTPICSGWLLRFFARRSGAGGSGEKAKGGGPGRGGRSDSRNSGTRGSGDTTAVPSTVEDSMVEDRGGGGSGAVGTGSALSRVSLRKKSFSQERCHPGQVSGCYSQFYQPTSPGVIESGGGPAGAEVPEGGARVQHLLRTSQLHSVTRDSLVSLRSEDSSSSDLGTSGKKPRGGKGYNSGLVGRSSGPAGPGSSKVV